MSLSKIINVGHKDQAADLLDGKPNGVVGGHHLNNNSKNQSWQFVDKGGNVFSFKNGTTGTYARVINNVADEKVVGGDEHKWKLVPGKGSYYLITTENGEYIWRLTGAKDYDPIVLAPASYDGTDAHWVYRPE